MFAKKQIPVTKDELIVTPSGDGDNRTIRITDLDFEFDIRVDDSGKAKLHFPLITFSDIHWGTQNSRAKRLCGVFENISMSKLKLIGDIFDGVHMLEKPTWNFAPWHHEGLAHVLRFAAADGTDVTYLPGNHDMAIRHRTTRRDGKPHHNLCDKDQTFLGIKIVEAEIFRDPKGRTIKFIHGDQHDDELFGRHKGLLYWVGDKAYHALSAIDARVQNFPKMDGFSIAAIGKRAVKTIINDGMGVRKALKKSIDNDDGVDVEIYGHTHMQDMFLTDKGKLIVNDGSCTEHVQAAAQDRHGNIINLEFHKKYLVIRDIHKNERIVYWDAMGLPDFKEEPQKFADEHNEKAHRVERLLYRQWPPRDRQKILKAAELRMAGQEVTRPITSHIICALSPTHKQRHERQKHAIEMIASGAVHPSAIPLPKPPRNRGDGGPTPTGRARTSTSSVLAA